jgi:hypothetical protein
MESDQKTGQSGLKTTQLWLRVVEEWNALLDHIKSLGKVHEFQPN